MIKINYEGVEKVKKVRFNHSQQSRGDYFNRLQIIKNFMKNCRVVLTDEKFFEP